MKLSIWVTKTCNMACSYCYEEGLIREDTGVCEIDYIEKTIEFINTMCYKTASKKIFIKFFGGEPLIKFPFIKKFVATVYKGNIIKNLIMDCQSYTKYRPNETTGGIFVSWRRKEELPTGA